MRNSLLYFIILFASTLTLLHGSTLSSAVTSSTCTTLVNGVCTDVVATITFVSTDTINSGTAYRIGSLAGGLLLYLKGTGLSSDATASSVLIGGKTCVIDPTYTSSSQIGCRTPAMTTYGAQNILVYINGVQATCDTSTLCNFTYTVPYTPVLYSLDSVAITQNANLQFGGVFRVVNSPSSFTLKFNDNYLCDFSAFSSQSFQGHLYDFAKCAMGPLPAGYYKTQLTVAGKGLAVQSNTFYDQLASDGQIYNLTVLPQITGLSSHAGTTAGEVLTITGTGFSTIPLENQVYLEQTPCQVISSTNTSIQCSLVNPPITDQTTLRPGQPGMTLRVLPGNRTIDELIASTDITSGAGTKISLLSAETAYDNRTDNYTEIMEGFFQAPVTGGYKFVLSSFGPSQLYISTVNGTKSNMTLIAAVTTGTPFRTYYSTQELNQTSANITLQAGNYYFLQALHYAYNQEHMSIGAIVPSQTRQFNSQRRVQQITMSGGCSLPAYTIKLIKTTSPIFFTLRANTSSPTFTSATFTYPGNISTFVDWMNSVYIPIVNVTRSQYDINGNLVYDDSLAQETRYSFAPSNSTFIGGMPVGYPTGYFSVITNVTGTILMGGFSTLFMAGQSLTFAFDLPPETLRDFLLAIPGVTAPKVTRYGNCRISCQWIIEYDNSVDNTAPPTITLGSTGQLTGASSLLKSFTLKTVQDGTSNNLLFSPIPYHMLFTPETTAQITVSTRGFPASCYNSQCSYLVKEAIVPTVTSFALRDKNVLDINLKDGGDLTLSGLDVTFASLDTYVASYDPVAQKLIAEVQLNRNDEPMVVAGTHIPQVLFNGSQLIKIADNVTGLVFSPNISSVSLDMDSLSSGVLSFNVYGSGFGYDLENSFGQIVTVDGITCEMVTLSNSQTYCTLYQPTDTGLVAVNVNAMSTNYAFNLERALNPLEITGQVLDPTTGEITITLNGTGFDTTTIVNLVNNKTNDTITCYVCSVTNLTIVCSTTGLPPGDYNIVTTTFDTIDTLSQLRTTMSVQLEIYSIEPSAGSQLGGTVITITGKGFSSIVNDNQVSLGYMLQTCDVFDANDTYIKCTIGANDNGYYEPQTVYVLQRLQFVADCKGNCTYLFSNDYTPTITDVSNTTIVSGDQLTLYGTNLTMNTQVYIGGVLAQVISANDSEIAVQVPEISAGSTINITAYDPVYGNVDVLDTIALNYTLQVLDYSPVNGSTIGTVLTITGKGFSSNAAVTVAGKACTVLTVNTTVLTCKIGNYRGTVLVTQDGTQISPNNNVNFTTASSFTPVITTVVGLPVTQAASQLNVTLKGSYLNIAQPVQIVLTSGSISYSGEILSISSSQIQAMFTLVPAGNYTLSAQIGPYYPKFNNASNTSVIIPITVNSVMPISSSYAGGLSLYVQGSGFSDNLNTFSIKIEGFNCTIQSVTFNTIVCKIPPLISDQTQPLYSFGQEQILVGTYFSAGTSENPFLAFDNSTVSYFKASSSITDCSFGIDVGEGLIAQVMQIQYYPKSGLSDLTTLSGSVFEGSVDGINYANLYTIDNHAYGGWNSINPPVPAGNVSGFRYIRYRRNNATDKCNIAEVSITGVLLSAIHSSDPTVVQASAKIQVNGVSLALPNVVQYRADKTPIVTSVYPTVGTYKGNTNLTLYGTNLNQTSKIKIDNLICDILSVSDTQVLCKTRPVADLTSNRIQGNITVFVEGSGKAVTTGVNYMYAEKWSDKDTWGCGGFPREGDSVYVTTGMNLILDVSPPKLVALIIEGALIFQDTDITLVAEYILVRNGFLQIGTESEPIQSNINITLYGTKSDEQLPIFGNKMIGLYEGTVDLHGKPRTVSTKLNVTGSPGQSVIHVQGPVDWKAGDRIAISSTSYDPTQTEQKTIVSVTGNSIQLDSALKYTHLVRLTPPVEGQIYEIRAEVVLLSRNVIIQGDYSSERLNYGAHMLFYDPGTESTIVRLSYIEVTSAGQTGYLGRFPVHFQHAGNQFRSYVIGCSIHHTYQRGIQLQGTSYLTIQKNLVFAVQGYGINLENGVERFNIFEDNIAMNGQTTVQYLTTQESPIGYRISSPTNFFTRNKALCNPSYGFWFDLQAYAAGAYSTTTICPNGEVLGVFENNVAAWNVNDGIRFDTYQPRTYPCKQAQYTNQVDPFATNPPVKAIFKNITVIGNANKGVEGVNVGTIIFDGLTAIDNAVAGFDFIFADASPINGTVVSNSVFIGSTYIETATTAYRGLRTCRSESCFLDNILFVNYTTTHPALESDAYTTSSSSSDSGARTIFLQALSFINVTVRTMFSHSSAHMFKDLDGSLTGIATGATVVNNMPHLQGLPGCTANTATYGGLVCNTTTVFKKIVFYSVASSNLLSQPLKVLRLNSSLSENNRSASEYSSVAYKSGRNPTSSYAIPFALGYSYKVFFNNSLDWTSLTYELSVHSVAEDAPMTLVFNYTAPRETFVFTKYGRLYGTVPVSNLTELWNIYSIIGSRGKVLGDWYMDADAGRLYVAMMGGNGTKVTSVGYQCLYTCPIPGNGSNDTLPKMSYYWSDNTIWPNETLPHEGDSITIPSNWVLTMDINPPALNYLEIQGELKFDDTNSTRDENILMAKKIWVRGKLTAGTSLDQRFGQKATITLIGTRDETSLLVNGNVEIGTKALAVTGQLLLYGQEVTEKFTLLESLYPGDTVIKTSRNLTGWEPGHLIALTTSRNEDAAYEIVQIASISDSNITLTTGVQYFHYSGVYTQQADNLVYNVDYSAEVILLNRSITIQGSREDNWGARLVVTEESNGYVALTGRADIQSVAFDYCGQYLQYSALSFETMNNVSAGVYSNLNSSVITNSLAWGIKFSETNNVRLMNTTILGARQFGVFFYVGSINVEVTGNRFIGVVQDSNAITLEGISTGLYIDDITYSTVIIQDNIASGCDTGFIIQAPSCDDDTSLYSGNIAHTSNYGFLVLSSYGQCAEIADLTAYRTVYGVFSYFGASNILARNLVLTDNNISININAVGDDTVNQTLIIQDSFFAAYALVNCTECYAYEDDCINRTAIMLGTATSEGKSVPNGPYDLPYAGINSYANVNANQTFTNNTFVNFQDGVLPQCGQNYVFRTNAYASDYTPPASVSASHLVNVTQNNLAYFVYPVPEQRCGNIPCTGLQNVLIKDIDGTLLGTKGEIIPSNTGVINTTTCTFIQSNNGFYICQDQRLAILGFESLDNDKTTRIISPAVVSNSNGFTNSINAFKAHDLTDTTTEFTRLARFLGLFQKNGTYNVEFSGTLPSQLQFEIEGATKYDYAILTVFYFEPIVVTVYNALTNSYISPVVSEFASLASIKTTDPCGTNYYDRDANTLNFKLTADPNCKVFLQRTSVLAVNVRYDMSQADFYEQGGAARFVDKVASILGISLSTIRVVSIVSGSVILNVELIATQQAQQYLNETKVQLGNFTTQLQQAIVNGDLNVYGAPILNYGFESIYAYEVDSTAPKDPIESSTNTILGESTLILFIAVGGAVIVVALGIYCVCRYRKRRINAKSVVRVSPPTIQTKPIHAGRGFKKVAPDTMRATSPREEGTIIDITKAETPLGIKKQGSMDHLLSRNGLSFNDLNDRTRALYRQQSSIAQIPTTLTIDDLSKTGSSPTRSLQKVWTPLRPKAVEACSINLDEEK